VAIMRNGELVEFAATPQIFRAPSHEYTRALLRALPRLPESCEAAAAAGASAEIVPPVA
jgi:peptide/nickel transport system ATP-binding protein